MSHTCVCVCPCVYLCALPGDGSRGPSANNLVTRLGAVPTTRQHHDFDADDYYNYKHRHYYYHYCHYNWRRVVATLFGQEITTNSVCLFPFPVRFGRKELTTNILTVAAARNTNEYFSVYSNEVEYTKVTDELLTYPAEEENSCK